GVFYEQFGVTLMVAIAISAVNALTLSPALSALFLKPHQHDDTKRKNVLKRFFTAFNKGFKATTERYVHSLKFLYRHKWITVVILIASVGAIFWASSTTPKGFVPDEDRGLIFANIELPAGATIDRTVQVTNELSDKARQIPGVSDVSLVNGFSIISEIGRAHV